MEEWFDLLQWKKATVKSYKASIALLSENNATQNNKFNAALILLKSELEYEKIKLMHLIKSIGV